jgi:glycosyltransferase involved in cell wall biosynthesis
MLWKIGSLPTYAEKYQFIKNSLNRKFVAVNWDIDTVYDVMEKADVGIIPVDTREDLLPGQRVSFWQVKSENRLTMKMAMGLPVVATPIPCYLDIIEHGKNGYLAETVKEWTEYLHELRDLDLRKSIGQQARRTVIRRFSMDEQARKLIAVLDGV